MKAQLAADARRLEEIPNIGPALADDLRAIGIKGPVDLKGKDGLKLYDQLNKTTGRRHDPCVADTFLVTMSSSCFWNSTFRPLATTRTLLYFLPL